MGNLQLSSFYALNRADKAFLSLVDVVLFIFAFYVDNFESNVSSAPAGVVLVSGLASIAHLVAFVIFMPRLHCLLLCCWRLCWLIVAWCWLKPLLM